MTTSAASPTWAATRSGKDRCPGVLRPYDAADGAIVRLRVPGGYVGTNVLQRLTELSGQFGPAVVQLTSRANLQLRGLPNPLPDKLVQAFKDLGLLPCPAHERARNIVADPLSARLRPMVAELDRRLCADSELADLPGRWLFALAEGDRAGAPAAGSILTTPWDLAFVLQSTSTGTLWVGHNAAPCDPTDAVGALLDRARCFLRAPRDERQWNVRDLAPDHPIFAGVEPALRPRATPLAPGRYGETLVVEVPHGLLTAAHTRILTEVSTEVQITPWRSIAVETGLELNGFNAHDARSRP